MAIYRRTYEGETTVIALNNTTEQQVVSISQEEIGKDRELAGLLNDDLIRPEDGNYTFVLDPEQSEIYLVKERSGLNYATLVGSIGVVVAFVIFVFLAWKRGKNDS